jgi:hypothetical protein
MNSYTSQQLTELVCVYFFTGTVTNDRDMAGMNGHELGQPRDHFICGKDLKDAATSSYRYERLTGTSEAETSLGRARTAVCQMAKLLSQSLRRARFLRLIDFCITQLKA